MSARLRIVVTPRAARDAIDGWTEDGLLRVRVRAAPADGAANDAVVRTLARALGVPPSGVRIVAGATARRKTAAFDLDQDELKARLTAGLHPPRRGSAAR